MGRSRYKILDERYPYFITSTVLGNYKIFSDDQFCVIATEALNFMVRERGVSIKGYIIMPNHLHLIAQGENLGKHVSSFKSYTARKVIDLLEAEGKTVWLNRFKMAKLKTKKDREHQFWCEGFHPKQIFSAKVMRQKLEYIHYNPVKAGLVEKEYDWLYSSYGDYFGDSSGLVDIDLFRG